MLLQWRWGRGREPKSVLGRNLRYISLRLRNSSMEDLERLRRCSIIINASCNAMSETNMKMSTGAPRVQVCRNDDNLDVECCFGMNM